MTLSQSSAVILLSGFTAIGLPFAYAWAASKVLPSWMRFIIACVASGVAGFLTAYVGGQINQEFDIIQNGSVILVASYGIYYGIFRGLGLEAVLFPRAGVINEAQKSVASQIGIMSQQTITDVTDPTCPTTIVVTAEKQDGVSPSANPVVPKG